MALWDLLSSKDSGDRQAKELWDRAIKYFDGKLYNRALKDMQEAIELHPAYLEEAMELMQAFSMAGNDDQAVSVGLALLKMDSGNVELMNKLGNSLRKLRSFDKAKRLYTHALKQKPNYTEARYNLAAASFRITTADSALIRQTKKVEAFKQPRRYEFQGGRMGFYPVPNESLDGDDGRRGKGAEEEEEQPDMSEEDQAMMRDAMVKDLKGDIESSPDEWEGHYNLGLLHDLFQMGEPAIEHYRKALEMDPENRFAGNNLGVALLVHNKNVEGAEATLLNNLGHHPFDRTTVLNLALVYRAMNKAFQQLKYFVYLGELLERSLGEFDTVKAEAAARDMFEKRKYLEAIPAFEHLAEEQGGPFWLEKLAVMYYNQKKEEDYIRTLRRLLKLDPQHAEAQHKLHELADKYDEQAREKVKRGSRHQAIQFYERAVKIVETPERWVELAQLYEEEGEEILMDNALKRWKKMTGEDADLGGGEPPAEEGASA